MHQSEVRERFMTQSLTGLLDGVLDAYVRQIGKEAAERVLARAVATVRVRHGLKASNLAAALHTAVGRDGGPAGG